MPAFSQWQDDIASRISRASSLDQAASLLASWASEAESDSAVSDAIYESALLANMAGQLQVRTVEVPEAMTAALTRRFDLAPARRSRAFLRLPFQEAIDDFRARSIVTPEQWARMDAAARQRAFTATRLATDSLRQHAYEQIARALEGGTTLADFGASLRSGELSLGVAPSDPGYVETVFRTNVMSAYGAGRITQMQAPEVLAARPYVQYVAIIDPRTTSVCRYLDGLVFDRRTDPGWSRFEPPNHYNCRSRTQVLPASRVSASQVVRSGSIDQRGQPIAPFDSTPTLDLDA